MLLGPALTLCLQAVPAAQQARPPEPPQRRERVQMMEGVLTRAVRSGAEQIANRMRIGNPNVTLFTGQARARGFILDGYGIFFDVEIPALMESVVWSMQTLERDLMMASALDSLRRSVQTMPDGPARLRAEQALKQMQQFSPAPSLAQGQGTPTGATAVAAAAETVSAPFDPQAAYTESVQHALVDAMVEYSYPMALQADEWLVVAARGSEGTLRPGEVYDPVTIVLRVKGADLADYYADRTKGDALRKRVEVRVF
jgi:hypothetical protein